MLYTASQKPLPGKHRQLQRAATALGIVSVLVPLLVFGVLPGRVSLLCWGSAYGLAVEASGTGARKAKA
ncbi:hypothetical protein [Streptomyces sp. NPDC014685]|uniref:hypothetical protein n=1 Tax=Streptomyces sp. NPDC014685 TaxID=3364881 RepID=UPI0036FBE189